MTELNPDGSAAGTVPVGILPHAIAFNGRDICVANQTDNTVTKLRAD